MEAWRGHFTLCSFKREATGRMCLFIIGVGAGKFVACEGFCLKSFLCNFCLQIFSHKDHEDLFLVKPPKKGLYVFLCKPWAPFFEVKQPWAPFLPGFSILLPRFSANQNFWGPAPPPPKPLLFISVYHKPVVPNRGGIPPWGGIS